MTGRGTSRRGGQERGAGETCRRGGQDRHGRSVIGLWERRAGVVDGRGRHGI